MKLIRVKEIIVNLDQVTCANFRPHRPAGFYDTGGPEPQYLGEMEARLDITLTSIVSSDWDGSFRGIGASSDSVTLYGADAQRTWDYMCNYMCDTVVNGFVQESREYNELR